MAIWPVTLPGPQINYGLNPVDQTIRTDMEVGAARTRRRTLARNDKVTVNWLMTDAQMAIFRTWFDSAGGANGGASWITMSLPIGTGGIVSTTVKFVGPPKITHQVALRWAMSAELEIQ